MWRYIPTEELYHHGVQGQKWGIRRYQNPDGTLTAEGKRRLNQKIDKYTNKYNKKDEKQKDKEWKKKYTELKKDKTMPEDIKKEISTGYDLIKQGEKGAHRALRNLYSTHLKSVYDKGEINKLNNSMYKKGYEWYKDYVDKNYTVNIKSNKNGNVNVDFIPNNGKTKSKETTLKTTFKSTKTLSDKKMQNLYNKYSADDLEGIYKNMSTAEKQKIQKQLPKNFDYPDFENYLYENYDRLLKKK